MGASSAMARDAADRLPERAQTLFNSVSCLLLQRATDGALNAARTGYGTQ